MTQRLAKRSGKRVVTWCTVAMLATGSSVVAASFFPDLSPFEAALDAYNPDDHLSFGVPAYATEVDRAISAGQLAAAFKGIPGLGWIASLNPSFDRDVDTYAARFQSYRDEAETRPRIMDARQAGLREVERHFLATQAVRDSVASTP